MNAFKWSEIPPYEWNGKSEQETIAEFVGFSKRLKKALDSNGKSEVEPVVKEILEWGGIRNSHSLVSEFSDNISICTKNKDHHWNIQEDEKKIKEIIQKAKKGNDYRISSWSKILAAYQPGVFYIYDSRVAIGLSVLEKYTGGKTARIWTIPPARGRNSIFGFISADIKGNKRCLDMKESYCQYLQKLKELSENPEINFEGFNGTSAKMAHVEKLLFMIPQMLEYHIETKFSDSKENLFSCVIVPDQESTNLK